MQSPSSGGIGLPDDTAIVKLPGVTTSQIETRTNWKLAINNCQLGEQDVQLAFGEDRTGPWTSLTWDGESAVCVLKQNQLPQEVLVRSRPAYDLFTDNNDGLASYL